jgi:Sec-independent protein translocase protein TatA
MDLNLFGIGPLELVFFVVLLLLLFGPTDLVRMARSLGKFVNRFTRSENYQVIQQASRELRNLPERLMQEAQIDELRKTMSETAAAAAPAKPTAAGAKPAGRPQPPALAAWNQELPAEAKGAEPAPPASPAPSTSPAPAADPAFRAWTQELPADPAAGSDRPVQ